MTADSEFRRARDEFIALLQRPDALEHEFQRLFAKCPYILTDGLSLGIEPGRLIPCSPGRQEADFYFYPDESNPLSHCGVIEIKRPSTKILREPRRDVFCLTADLVTGVAQANKYAHDIGAEIRHPMSSLFFLGNRAHMFVIAGLTGELAKIAWGQTLANQVRSALGDVQLCTYDWLLDAFRSRRIPPRLMLLVPSAPAILPGRADTGYGASGPRGYGRLGGRGFFEARIMYRGICSDCGMDTLIPFKPVAGRPLFCRGCYSEKRAHDKE